jgi:Tol biopolymer transport system component
MKRIEVARLRLLAISACLVLVSAGSVAAWSQDQSGDVERPAAKSSDLPLEPAGKLEFTTDEGTWISLSLTPDGETIVFELLGDFYTVPITGGTAERITEGMAYDSQPVVSPDGEWIAFISDRDGADNLWIARIDGSEPHMLSSERQSMIVSPTWTPDSQYVIVSRRSRGAELRMYHINGGSGITLRAPSAGGGAGTTPGGPGGGGGNPTRLGVTMSPDGRFLYFAQAASSMFGARFPRWQIGRMDMRTGDVDVITQAEGGGMRPVLSPDGRQLVYATRHETQTGLRVRDLETGADRWLIWPVQRDEQEGSGMPSRDVLPGFAFTPDGQEIVLSFDGRIQRVNVASGAVAEVPFTADVSLDIGPDLEFPYRVEQGPVRAKLIQDPRLSPDGNRLTFSVLTKIYVMDVGEGGATGEPRRLTSGDAWEFKPAWSPDGEWIAYVTWSMDGGHIYKARVDGTGTPVQLTEHPAFYADLVFSPDGERIVGLRGNEYQRHQTFSEFGGLRIPLDLVWLSADGGDVELIVPGRGVGAPHFADDPDRIYVYSREGLMSLRYDGTDRRAHLKVTGPGRAGSSQPPAAESVLMRPDGKWALAKVNNQLWLVAVPPYTGSAASVNVRGPALPVQRLTDIGVDYFAWADGGETVTWAIGSTFYQRPFDSVDFSPPSGSGRASAGEGDAEGPGEGGAEEQEEAGAAAVQEEAGTEGEELEDEIPLDLAEAVESIEVVMEFPRAKPEGTIALRHAMVITMAGENGDLMISDGDVVVTDNRITAVGPSGEVEIPAGARVMDFTGKYIVPGFVDTHAHWEFRTHDVLEPQNWSLIANLAYGVTAGLDVQTSTNDYFAYSDLVETGQSIGQRAFMTGVGIFSNNDFQSYEATLSYLKRYKEHYRTPNIKSYMVGNRQQRQWVVMAAKELELIPTTEGGADMKMDLTHAIDGMHGNEHTLPVIPLYKDVVELFARTRTAYTPTLLVQYGAPIADEYFFTRTEVHDDVKLNRFYPHNRIDEMSRRRGVWVRDDEFAFDDAAAQAAKIQRAGGLIGVGGHGELQGLGYHWEMWAYAMGGMTPLEVLRAATIGGAEIIGFQQDLGSIEVGKLADLIVLDANPLENIRHTNTISYVMKNGELYEGDTLNQVWPVERELPAFWWWSGGPAERRTARQ